MRRSATLTTLALALLLVPNALAQGDPPPGNWDPAPGVPGIDGSVFAAAAGPDGSIYVGGTFTLAGGEPVNHVARWDGAAWIPLGEGVGAGAQTPIVYALSVGPDGALYAGGLFTTAGGQEANRIARWDGEAWSPLGAGVAGSDFPSVRALAWDASGALYAAGSFTTAGGAPAANIARWDGEAWSPLGAGLGANTTALVFDGDGALYAGGRFTTAGGTPAVRVARWDGEAWSALGSGIAGGLLANVFALAVATDGTLYVGGSFTTAGGSPAANVAQWDGEAWSAVGSGLTGPGANVLALSLDAGGTLYAGGRFTTSGEASVPRVARWNGEAWASLGAGVAGESSPAVFAFAPGSDGGLTVAGVFETVDAEPANNVARWLPATTSAEEGLAADGALALSVSPNPARERATLRVQLLAPGPATVTVYDVLGRVAVAPVERLLGEGVQEVGLDLRSLAPGMYVARVVRGTETASVRFTVVR